MKSRAVSFALIGSCLLLVAVLAIYTQAGASAGIFQTGAAAAQGRYSLARDSFNMQAQPAGPAGAGGGNNLPTGAGSQPVAVNAALNGQLSYQGRLIYNGNPYNGNKNITFRIYSAASGDSAWWSETQNVTVQYGLFNVMLGAVNPLTPFAAYFQNQTYLGIQPAGAASELTPRQPLGTAAYAYSLVPGATMYDASPAGGYNFSFWVTSNNHAGIYSRSNYTDSVGIYSEATGAQKNYPPIGVSGYSANGYGVKGTSGSTTGTGVFGAGKYGVYGTGAYSDTVGVFGFNNTRDTNCFPSDLTCGAAINGTATSDAYAERLSTKYRSALLAQSQATSYWDIYDYNTNGSTASSFSVNGKGFFGGYVTFSGGKSGYVVDVALNAGAQPLERGDVVAILGYEKPVIGQIPVARIARATAANASAIMGIVDVLYAPCTKSDAELQAGEVCGGFDPTTTTIQPGQYLSVVTLGAYAYLKVDASNGPIQPGDLLTVSATDGSATRAVQITVQGVSFYAPGAVLGKAMGGLDSGTGYIPVFVTIR